MATSTTKPITTYRRKLKRRGVVRVEVHVAKGDAPLIRGIAQALTDPATQTAARTLLRERFGMATGFKSLLASAPLDGIDLSRDRDLGRDVAL
ncbi:hypothetical protein [Pseudorhodoplanes sp.]|uniref:hypothetical protein n=1 Tax=Pseudorhodoplanes sp. TaxID=1934341 RepID=UPI0039191FC1